MDMKQNPTDDELLRGYLLGELPEDAADRLERRLLAEDELFELSEAVEADLLAACDRGELVPEERERVLQRLASSPQGRERLALAHSLNAAARSSQATTAPLLPFRRRLPAVQPAFRWAALAAAALLAAVGLYWIALERQQGGASAPWTAQEHPAPAGPVEPQVLASPTPPQKPAASEERHPAPKPGPSKAVFQLALMTLRGAESTPKLRVPLGTEVVELQIAVEGMDDLKSFHVTVRSESAGTVWDKSGLAPKMLSGARALVIDLPADRLPAGKYEIQAQGTAPGSAPEDLSPLEVEVVRSRG